jgi:hypothetical protein
MVRAIASGHMADAPTTRPAEVGDATVTEIRRDDGRLLLIYRWPAPADTSR